MLQKMLWLAFAGGCGTVSRFLVCEAATKVKGLPIPLGTLAVNVLGSFLFGLIYVAGQKRLIVSPETRVILLAGFTGGFTTFSALAFETARMLNASQWVHACGNVLVHTILGILALGAGALIGRML